MVNVFFIKTVKQEWHGTIRLWDANQFNVNQEHFGMDKHATQMINTVIVLSEHTGTTFTVHLMQTLALKGLNGMATTV